MNDIWPMLITAMLTAVSTYVGFIHKLRIKVAVLEHKVEKVDERLDRKSRQFDEIQKDLSDIKADIRAISEVLNIIRRDSL